MYTNLELQQKQDSFQVGSKCFGTVVMECNNELYVQLNNGKKGVVEALNVEKYQKLGIKFFVKMYLEFEVLEIKPDVVLLGLSEMGLIRNMQHKAKILFSNSKGMVVQFDYNGKNYIGFYNPSMECSKEFMSSPKDTVVLCQGLCPQKGYYQIRNVKIWKEPEVKTEPKLQPIKKENVEIYSSWSEQESIDYASKNGGYLTYGAYKIGVCYVAMAISRNVVCFSDNKKAYITQKADNVFLPQVGDKVVVRLLKIHEESSKKDVELLEIVDEDYIKEFTQQQDPNLLPESIDEKLKKRYTYVDSGCIFGLRDEDAFKDGKGNGSLLSYEKYWLGFLYKSTVKNGKPVLEDNSLNSIPLEVIENPQYSTLTDGNIAFVRIHFIRSIAGHAELTVKVEYSRPMNESEKKHV